MKGRAFFAAAVFAFFYAAAAKIPIYTKKCPNKSGIFVCNI